MTEREKIAQLLCKQTGSNENRECATCPFNGCIAQRQADKLIENGIRDTSNLRRKLKIANRALNKACLDIARTHNPSGNVEALKYYYAGEYMEQTEEEIESEENKKEDDEDNDNY